LENRSVVSVATLGCGASITGSTVGLGNFLGHVASTPHYLNLLKNNNNGAILNHNFSSFMSAFWCVHILDDAFFHFTLSAPTATVTFSSCDSDFNSFLRLLDLEFRQIAENDNSALCEFAGNAVLTVNNLSAVRGRSVFNQTSICVLELYCPVIIVFVIFLFFWRFFWQTWMQGLYVLDVEGFLSAKGSYKLFITCDLSSPSPSPSPAPSLPPLPLLDSILFSLSLSFSVSHFPLDW
jgi:hypothetical protein